MEASTTATWNAFVDGEPVEVPATIAGIRAQLDPDRQAEFDEVISATPAQDLHRVLALWALPDAAWTQINQDFERLEAGDHTGFHPSENVA
ncbi:hypothetical protein GTW66_13970 [Streptomyces sp. SID5473]|uniref:Uncharacterized protein n=1 Tax=Streptomyces tsukubensis (strain DSM 42081 / NBRC 108919 / NRRL 18488 / 9993) TaxID=1114943 RepID=I2MT27_STRT9|nr:MULTISPECIES: hypothetical protein [Streptomyces]EIF87924.1 hypothetical protein [Streptomyces tsukubensis NRRL18488]MYS65136.1 hypothetical protein [Streptomyces sp. SID5473]QKM65779.1 hypothetical protein STSU_000045 [Streptomyces tsukubensis NRRL18488]